MFSVQWEFRNMEEFSLPLMGMGVRKGFLKRSLLGVLKSHSVGQRKEGSSGKEWQVYRICACERV